MEVPRSNKFDDVYFSIEDGLAESRYVFLQGNNLSDAWAGQESFTICETGFGTGLNFLAVLKLWCETDIESRPKNLQFISFEKYPLSRDEIRAALSHWDELQKVLDIFLPNYPIVLNNDIHELQIIDGVNLTLIFGDMNDVITKVHEKIDCWFLDGFKPSSNPDMWSDILFENMARLSSDGASFATFTAAGFVRRALIDHGFDVRKIKGFAHKREMIVGNYEG